MSKSSAKCRIAAASDLPGFAFLKKMPDVDLASRHPALQSMCSKD